jgi:protein phosphatase
MTEPTTGPPAGAEVDPTAQSTPPSTEPMRLVYSAISDVGRVRKNNQDAGYAGPWLLAVCDGVGGAAHGEIASATAINQLRRIDAEPNGRDLLGLVSGGIHRAHVRIGELVEDDAALRGTSTTATVGLFDGHRLAMGHLGDSRAYLWRRGELRQITQDHTFVQSLIDEGRITEDEAGTHPHRNIILKALDGSTDLEPDLFIVDLEAGDRIFVCSDGASGFLSHDRLADILATGSADFAAVELVRASLEAGSSDNVTCVVADVVPADRVGSPQTDPLLVGSAAELPRRGGGALGNLFRGHRAGDTGEMEPIAADLPDDAPAYAIASDPLDPEAARYAPREPRRLVWLTRLMVLLVLAGLAWIGLAAAWSWSQQQFFVSDHEGKVAIFRGLNTDLPGVRLHHPYETTDVELSRLSDIDAEQVSEGIESDDLGEARSTVDKYAARQD